MPDPTPQRETILTSLERLLAWPEIARSQQLAKFLEYIVDRTLAGDGQSIKAYSIAVDVLGRSVDFDPQADPIVRVQARRLRSLLDEYYRGPGRSEAVRIKLPVGRYVPDFCFANVTVESDGGNRAVTGGDGEGAHSDAVEGVRLSWSALVMMVLGVVVLGVVVVGTAMVTLGPLSSRSMSNPAGLQRPKITVVEFQNLAEQGLGAPQVAGLAIELVTDLDQFDYIDVRYGGSSDMAIEIADGAVSDYALTGIVRRVDALVQYSAILTDSASGIVVWSDTVALTTREASDPSALDYVSRRLSLILGSSRGPLHVKARDLLATAPDLDEAASLYLCRMLFDLYREAPSAVVALQISECLFDLPDAERLSAAGLAMSASLLVDRTTVPDDTLGSAAERMRVAEADLDRAIGLSPVSAFIWEQHARLQESKGNFTRAQIDYGSAIQLNPANADTLASYARLLAFSGKLSEAEAMARDAAERSPNPPDWYFGVPALLDMRSGDYDRAIESAVRYARADAEIGPVLAIIAAQGSGDTTIVNRYLAQVLDVASFRTNGVLPRLRLRIEDDALLEQIRSSLTAAGVPPLALTSAF